MGTNNQAIKITDFRKIVNGSAKTIEEATTRISNLVVPSAQQIIFENTKRKIDEERKAFEKLSDEEANAKIGTDMPFSEMVKCLRDSLNATYPGTCAVIVAAKPNGNDHTMVFENYGDLDVVWSALSMLMERSKDARDFVNGAMIGFCRHCKPEEAEQCVTALQDFIKDLRAQSDPHVLMSRMQHEIKRLRKEGRFDLMHIKEQELKELNDSLEMEKRRKEQEQREIQERLERQKRRKEANLKNLEKARAAKAEKKRRQEQLEKERNRQQPNFSKMAKKKMQKIKERQAAKKQKSGSEDNVVKSCSMFNNVG